MTNTLPQGLQTLAGAWREFQTWTPVKLRLVEDDQHYRAMVGFLNNLLDEIGDRETHPLVGLLEIGAASCGSMRSPMKTSPIQASLERVKALTDRDQGAFPAQYRALQRLRVYAPPGQPSWTLIQVGDLHSLGRVATLTL